MLTAARLLERLPDATVRRVLAQQVEDESRHAEVFERYARAVGGSVAPPLPWTDHLLMSLSSISSPHELFLIHTLLEALAVDEFALLVEAFAGDPLSAIYARVRRDEARHVANGMIIIKHFAKTAMSREFCCALERLPQKTLDIAGVTDEVPMNLAKLSGRSVSSIENLILVRHMQRCRRLQLLFHSQDGGA